MVQPNTTHMVEKTIIHRNLMLQATIFKVVGPQHMLYKQHNWYGFTRII